MPLYPRGQEMASTSVNPLLIIGFHPLPDLGPKFQGHSPSVVSIMGPTHTLLISLEASRPVGIAHPSATSALFQPCESGFSL